MLRVTHRQPGPPGAACCSALLPLPGASRDAALLAYVASGAVVVAPLQASGAAAPQVLRPASGDTLAADVSRLAWTPQGGALAVVSGSRTDVYAWPCGAPSASAPLLHAGSFDGGAHVVTGAPARDTLLSLIRADLPHRVAPQRCAGPRTVRRCYCATLTAASRSCAAERTAARPRPLTVRAPPLRVMRTGTRAGARARTRLRCSRTSSAVARAPTGRPSLASCRLCRLSPPRERT